MKTEDEIRDAESFGSADAKEGREPLWYRVGESYVSAETGHIGNDELCAAYIRGYSSAASAAE